MAESRDRSRLAILVHGLATSHTDRSILDDLIPALSDLGFEVIQFRYGFLSVIGAVTRNRKIASRLSRVIQSSLDFYDNVLVIGHSNGCALMDLASDRIQNDNKSNKTIGYVYISPAASTSKAPGPAVSWLDVWFNPRDYILKCIRFVMRLSLVIHRSKWGLMGIQGYRGDDPRVHNFELDVPYLGWLEQHGAFFFSLHSHLHFFKQRIRNLIHIPEDAV